MRLPMFLLLGASEESLRARVRIVTGNFEDGLRLDEAAPRSQGPTTAARAMLHDYAGQAIGRRAANAIGGDGFRTDEASQRDMRADVIDAVADRLGYQIRGAEVVDPFMRADEGSLFLPRDLTDVSRTPIRPPPTTHVLTDGIPVRTVAAWAERATTPYVQHSAGGAGGFGDGVRLVGPGATENIPIVGTNVSELGRPIHTFGCQTIAPWLHELADARSIVNRAAEDATAARKAHQDFLEAFLRGSAQAAGGVVAGLDAIGVAQLGAPHYNSPVNYATSTDSDAIFADLVAWLQNVRRGGVSTAAPNGVRAAGRSIVLMGGRWIDAIRRRSNYANGGGDSGAAIIRAFKDVNGLVEAVQGEGGMQALIECPSLEGIRLGDTYDSALALPSADREALRQLQAMTPAPVYDYQGPAGRATYWVARHGALEQTTTLGLGVATAQTET